MFCCLIRHFWPFWPSTWPKIGQIFVGVYSKLNSCSFSVKKPLYLMQQNQRNGVEELTYVSFGFDRHNALI